MIISASRRTDIPAYYPHWLINRVRAGFARVKNPYGASEREVSLRPGDVDCIVLWTKDPLPLMPCLSQLDGMGIQYYFQFTLTPYGGDIEPGLRDKRLIAGTFAELSRRVGPERVVWRYDPVAITPEFDVSRHIREFSRLCAELEGTADSVTISFVDMYSRLKSPAFRAPEPHETNELAAAFAAAASERGFAAAACCESAGLERFGIVRASCVDAGRIARITGKCIDARRDGGQRPGCGCVKSVDIGAYNTCPGGCAYCYAVRSAASARKNALRHDPESECLTVSG